MTQRIIPIDSPLFVRESDLQQSAIDDLFPHPRPLALEIGCGIGDFMVQLAAAHPQRNFLAIDIFNKGCLKTCRRMEKAGLDNVRVMRIEARYLLATYIAPQSLAAVYINCPDPWPKKRHRERRLVSAGFMRQLLCYLKPEADFYFSTDFADYAAQVAELLPEQPGFCNMLPVPMVTALPGYPVSKYMRRFLDRGEPIHYLHYRRLAEIDPELLIPAPLDRGFRSDRSLAGHG